MVSSMDKDVSDPAGLGSLVEFGLALRRAQHLFALRADEALRPIDLNLGLWAVLREAARMPGASASELARASFHTPQTLGGLLQRLESRGLVVRSTGRGRIVENHLTETGQVVLRQATERVESIIAAALDGFSEDDRETFNRLAVDLVAALA